jgi:hypothetical protein
MRVVHGRSGGPSAGTVMGAIGMAAGLAALVVSLGGVAGAVSNGNRLIHKGELARGAVTRRRWRRERFMLERSPALR